MKEKKFISNNKKIEILRDKINEIELRRLNESNPVEKLDLTHNEIQLRKEYTMLLQKKRPILLTFGILFCFFYGISLMACLPPYILRGKKIEINEDKIIKLKVELDLLSKQC